MNKAERLASIIAQNPSFFRRGKSITADEFRTLFGQEFPATITADIESRVGSMPFINAYVTVNRVLRHQGRALKFTNENVFLNRNVASVKDKIDYTNKVRVPAIIDNNRKLQAGLSRASASVTRIKSHSTESFSSDACITNHP